MHRELLVEGLRWLGATLLLIGGVSFVATFYMEGSPNVFLKNVMLVATLLLLPGGIAVAVGNLLERRPPGGNSDVSNN